MRREINLLAGTILIMVCLSGPQGNAQVFSEQAFKLNRVISLVENYYVETVDEKELVEQAIIDVLRRLDPHSVYIPADEVKESNDPLVGNFEGIGVQFNLLNDTILIISPISGGPSEKVGILAGDRIVVIGGENVAGKGITTKQVQDRLMGPKGTKVDVSIRRRGVKNLLEFTITRDKIPINSLDAAYMLDHTTAYVKLNRFSFTTVSEFNEALFRLKKQGMKDLVVDLRGNGGGYMEVAVNLLDKFFAENKLVVYMEGNKTPRRDYYTTSTGELKNARVILLVDEGSASASEIMAGAIQDWDRGLIIGRRSFGKGLVQRPFNLPDGAMVRLTIARYYTPSGRSIQKSYENGYSEYLMELNTRYAHGEFTDISKIEFPDSLKYKTLVSGRTVYGGGGIMPDVFIPLDTSGYTDYYRNIVYRGILNRFILDYVDKNRSGLANSYSSFDMYLKQFVADDNMIEQLVEFGEKEGLARNPEQLLVSKNELGVFIKAIIARDLWDSNEYFRVLNQDDQVIHKSLEIMRSPDLFARSLVTAR